MESKQETTPALDSALNSLRRVASKARREKDIDVLKVVLKAEAKLIELEADRLGVQMNIAHSALSPRETMSAIMESDDGKEG